MNDVEIFMFLYNELTFATWIDQYSRKTLSCAVTDLGSNDMQNRAGGFLGYMTILF
jgi:hypothetical protein